MLKEFVALHWIGPMCW